MCVRERVEKCFLHPPPRTMQQDDTQSAQTLQNFIAWGYWPASSVNRACRYCGRRSTFSHAAMSLSSTDFWSATRSSLMGFACFALSFVCSFQNKNVKKCVFYEKRATSKAEEGVSRRIMKTKNRTTTCSVCCFITFVSFNIPPFFPCFCGRA